MGTLIYGTLRHKTKKVKFFLKMFLKFLIFPILLISTTNAATAPCDSCGPSDSWYDPTQPPTEFEEGENVCFKAKVTDPTHFYYCDHGEPIDTECPPMPDGGLLEWSQDKLACTWPD